MFGKNLKRISEELSKYANLDHVELFHKCITYKLAVTLQNYNEEIDLNSDYLLRRSTARVLKALTTIQKRNDMDSLIEAADMEEIEND